MHINTTRATIALTLGLALTGCSGGYVDDAAQIKHQNAVEIITETGCSPDAEGKYRITRTTTTPAFGIAIHGYWQQSPRTPWMAIDEHGHIIKSYTEPALPPNTEPINCD